MIRLSKYVILFKRNDNNFVYNARTNSFYLVPEEAFSALQAIKQSNKVCKIDENFMSLLKEKKILTTSQDDSSYYDCLKLAYMSQAFSTNTLGLTIVPTISCNLNCPYCFEQTKPYGIMDEQTISNLIKFIENRSVTNKYAITWFGGEPLLGLNAIKKILSALEIKKQYKLISHSIITNGTLLSEEAIDFFHRYPLDSMQVTFDGDRSTHDKKRFLKSGDGTFDMIVNNISKFLEVNTSTHIDIRINVDNQNKNKFFSVYNYLSNKFKNYPVHIYPGILRANKGCEEETFFSSKDHLDFYKTLWEKNICGLYPKQCSKGCCATSISQYVIGPRGELYQCWEHVGKNDKIIGYIDGKPGNATNLYGIYKLQGHCFDDPRCKECSLLPLCSGGCPDKRIANLFMGEQHNLCSVYQENNGEGLEDARYKYYLSLHNDFNTLA